MYGLSAIKAINQDFVNSKVDIAFNKAVLAKQQNHPKAAVFQKEYEDLKKAAEVTTH